MALNQQGLWGQGAPPQHETEDMSSTRDEDLFYSDDNPVSFREQYVREVSWYSRRPNGANHASVVGDGPDAASHLGESTIGTEEYDAVDEIARLYVICEAALPRGDENSANLSKQKREQLDRTWEAMREWLTAHPSEQDRQLAAMYQGHLNTAVIHLVCKLPDPPLDVVEALIQCSREAVSWQDANGWLPLHHACANGASGEVLSRLCDAHPQGKVTQDRRRRTPLHFAFFRVDVADEADDGEGSAGACAVGNSMAGIVRLLSSMDGVVRQLCDTSAACLADENGMLPMHYACAYGTSAAVLEVLEAAFPESIVARERHGRTPLHLAMVNAHRRASPGVLSFLLSRGAMHGLVNVTDNEGNLPLYNLATAAAKFAPDHTGARDNAAGCLRMYLDAGPEASADFLNAIQALPEWLRDDAVINPHVQDILNAKIIRRFPTAVLMTDFYFLVILIICFAVTSGSHIDFRVYKSTGGTDGHPLQEHTGDLVYLMIIGGVYFLLREVVQVVAMVNLGSFRSWLFDWENWLDCLVIFLVLFNSSLMFDNYDIFAEEILRGLIAITQIVLLWAFISFLKSIRVGFAVFLGGVFFVVRRLFSFIVCVIVFLFAFAMMFEITYQTTELCFYNGTFNPNTTDNKACYEGFPHCGFWTSLLKVYTMMMGEIGEECRYQAYPGTPADSNLSRAANLGNFIYFIYAFVVVIILSNVLIAIVTQNYDIIKNERSAMVFWSNRLDFVAEMDAIGNFMQTAWNLCFCARGEGDGGAGAGAPGAPAAVQETPGGEGIATGANVNAGIGGGGAGAVASGEAIRRPFSDTWSAVVSLFDPDLLKEMEVRTGSGEFWFYLLLKVFTVLFIMPVWVIAGFFTAGILWPPQVREWFFVQKRSASAESARSAAADQVRHEVEQIKREVARMRADFRREVGADRRELAGVKAEVEGVQREVLSDLALVREIMTTLIQQARERIREREERAIALAQHD